MIYDHWCTDLLLQLRGLQLNRKQLFNAAHWNFSEPGSSHAAYAIKIYWMKSETNGHTGHKNNPTQSKASLHSIYIFIFIWVNYNSSLTWIKAIWGWFPLLTMIIVRSQWGRYNLPRFIIIIRYTYINKYIYIYVYKYIYISISFLVQKSWSHRVIFVDFRRSPGSTEMRGALGFPSWDDTQNSAPGWDPTNPMDAGKRLHKQWYHNI